MRLLIIEDSDGMAKVIRHYVDDLFEEIEVVDTMEKALESLLSHIPDVIWQDLMLPDSTAEESMQKIPTFRLACPKAMIVVMSGANGKRTEDRCIELGADAFLSKHNRISANSIVALIGLGCFHRIQEEGDSEKSAELLERIAKSLAKVFKQ